MAVDENIVWHHHVVDKNSRAELKQQKPAVLWFTGLSGSGKSTLAGALEQALASKGYHTYLLDGDNVRHGLCQDLGFSDADRKENIRRVGELCKLMADAGLIVLSAFISPQKKRGSWFVLCCLKESLLKCILMPPLKCANNEILKAYIRKQGW